MPLAVQPSTADFPTCLHPEDFEVDWPAFYRRGLDESQALRRQYRNEAAVLYGDRPFQILNLYLPNSPDRGWPLFAFLHGGAFREGHPDYYDFLGRAFLEQGIGFASLGYRLSPEATYPGIAQDVEHAITWLFRNLSARGGDPGRIHIGGHSSGAILASNVAVRSDWAVAAGLPVDVVKGLVHVSGPSDLHYVAHPYPDEIKRSASPALNISRPPRTTILAYGVPSERNRKGAPFAFGDQTRAYAQALRAAGTQVLDLPLDGLDHIGTALAISDEHSPLFQAAARMCREEATSARG